MFLPSKEDSKSISVFSRANGTTSLRPKLRSFFLELWEKKMRKLACFCDRCAVSANWQLTRSRFNIRWFDLEIFCHGESERFSVSADALLHVRDPATGAETTSLLYVIAFEGERPNHRVRLIEAPAQNLSIRIWNPSNSLMGEAPPKRR
jgi:hypothetical protein